MKLKYQVCSLELSKKLKELGVKQESLFSWDESQSSPLFSHISFICNGIGDNKHICCAFTASELIEMMPYYSYEIIKSIRWIDVSCEFLEISFKCETLCNTLAKMFIHLIENKIIEV